MDVKENILNILNDNQIDDAEVIVTELSTTNKGLTKHKGYSYKFYNGIIFRFISNMKNVYRFEFNNLNNIYEELLNKKEYDFKKIEKSNYIIVDVPKNEISITEVFEYMKSYILKAYKYLYEHQKIDNFGCCSRYLECSDAKKCIHPDTKFSKGCIYNKSLENGIIFYGTNKNN